MKKAGLFFLYALFLPVAAQAQSAAPEMFGVNQVVIEYVHFDNQAASDSCGLSRDQVASVLAKTLADTGVPAIPVIDAKPVASGVARISLIPEIASHVDESLGCVSWISLSAESSSKVLILPVNTPRDETIVYWRQHVMLASGQSIHGQRTEEVLQKLALKFVQQYKLDQPPEIAR